MQSTTRILLTGASGTVGRAILKQLYNSANTFDLTIFDIDSPRNRKVLKPYRRIAHIIYGDISQQKDIEAACHKQDIVIHLAAIIPPLADKKIGLAKRVNVDGTRFLIEGLKKHSPDSFLLYASSISVYGDRLHTPNIRVDDPLQASEGDYYAQTKILAEEAIRHSHLNWSIFRLTFISGIKNHKMSPLMFHQPLETKLELATPEDTARAFINAIDKRQILNKNIYNLGGGEKARIDYHHFLSRMFKIYGLGRFNFPKNTFASKNFHCGYYVDGDELENILHFRQDNIEHYFKNLRAAIPGFRRFVTRLFSPLIKLHLIRISEPLKAIHTSNLRLIYRFFGEMLPSDLT